MKSYETSDTDPVSRQAESNSFDKIFARKAEVYRILYITFLAVINAVIVGCIAKVLLLLINLITNVSFYGTFEIHETSPAHNALGLFVIAVPVIGGLIVGLIARYGSRAVRGHGIPEAMEKIITNESKIHPIITYPKTALLSTGPTSGIRKVGSVENKTKCMHAPVIQAIITGKKLLDENSKSSNSMARSIAANGVPKIAVIPAVAPAASKTFRSCAVMCKV